MSPEDSDKPVMPDEDDETGSLPLPTSSEFAAIFEETNSSAGAGERPKRIGPYKVLEVLGEGGMGVIYLAEQREPIRRRVALKVIKLGMDTKEVIAR